jgi:hypothetical protein
MDHAGRHVRRRDLAPGERFDVKSTRADLASATRGSAYLVVAEPSRAAESAARDLFAFLRHGARRLRDERFDAAVSAARRLLSGWPMLRHRSAGGSPIRPGAGPLIVSGCRSGNAGVTDRLRVQNSVSLAAISGSHRNGRTQLLFAGASGYSGQNGAARSVGQAEAGGDARVVLERLPAVESTTLSPDAERRMRADWARRRPAVQVRDQASPHHSHRANQSDTAPSRSTTCTESSPNWGPSAARCCFSCRPT